MVDGAHMEKNLTSMTKNKSEQEKLNDMIEYQSKLKAKTWRQSVKNLEKAIKFADKYEKRYN